MRGETISAGLRPRCSRPSVGLKVSQTISPESGQIARRHAHLRIRFLVQIFSRDFLDQVGQVVSERFIEWRHDEPMILDRQSDRMTFLHGECLGQGRRNSQRETVSPIERLGRSSYSPSRNIVRYLPLT